MSIVPSVSVTIVNHGTQDHLRACLQSLDRHPYTLGPMEVIVLDNASEDHSLKMLREEFPHVVVIAEQVRRGFGANQNRAIAAAGGDLVFMLNPDATVNTGTIDTLVRSLQRDQRVVAAGCQVLNTDGTTRQEWPFPFPTPIGIYAKALGLGRARRKGQQPPGLFDDHWLSGGAMLIDRNVFLEAGGFDEDFFMYSEDVDLCKRLLASGHLFTWVSEASVVHPLARESPAASQRRQREIVRAELSYMDKHHGGIGRRVYRVGAALDSAVRLLALRIPGLSGSVSLHGASVDDTRLLHRSRLQAVLRPYAGERLGDLATRWNADYPQAGSPSTSERFDDDRPAG